MSKLPKALSKEISKGSIGFLVVRILSSGLVLVSLLLLTHVLGASEYGRYTYALSIIALIVTLSQLGLPTLILRETAQAQTLPQWERVNGLWLWSLRNSLIIAIFLSGSIFIFLRWYQSSNPTTDSVSLSWVALLIPPIMVALDNRVVILRGLLLVVFASFIQRSAVVLVLVAGLSLAAFAFKQPNITAELALSFEAVGFFTSLLLAIFYLQKIGKKRIMSTQKRRYERRYWITAAIPLAMIVGLRTINTNIDVITLGWFEPAAELGVYKIAVRVSTIALLGQEVVVMVLSGHFARLHAQKEYGLLETLAKRSARWNLLIASTVLIIFVLFGRPLLELTFGEEFKNAYTPLLIITFAYTCSTSLGVVSTLLNMTGHEKRTAKGAVIATSINIVLNFCLIPLFGISGAAIATSISLMVWNVYLWISARSLLSINPSII